MFSERTYISVHLWAIYENNFETIVAENEGFQYLRSSSE